MREKNLHGHGPSVLQYKPIAVGQTLEPQDKYCTQEKAKVVAAGWVTYMNTAQTIQQQG